MATRNPIDGVRIAAPETAALNSSAKIDVSVDADGAPIDAIVPIRVRIFDPAGIEAEFSGYHAAVAGQLTLTIDFAPNDREGMWEIHA